jgi:hypothetical protein
MEIGEIGHLGHRVHERVEVLYKNHSDSVIIQSKFRLNNLRENILLLYRPENGGRYCSGQSTRIRSCEDNPVDDIY